jgi:hypothetical protein
MQCILWFMEKSFAVNSVCQGRAKASGSRGHGSAENNGYSGARVTQKDTGALKARV